MPPMTAAEKQKKYRDKLKNQNPQKYKEIQKKAKERAARYYAKKKSSYTEEQKQELRQKWKEDRNKAKYAKMASQNESAQTSNSKQDNNQLTCRNLQRRIEYRLKQETAPLKLQLNKLSKGFKGLQKKIIRQQNKIDKMQADYENVLARLITAEETKDTRQLEEKTPRKEVTEFINNTIPNSETAKKEEVKKKLFEYNVLTKSLKLKLETANNTEKNFLRQVLDTNIVKKYKLKTRLRTSLGFKSNFKNYHQRKTKTSALQKKIECFFNRDDVSRATAGKKEYRTFKKVTRQKRYLLDKLIVLHRKFIAEVGQISFSTFKKYRPFYVLSPKIKDCESCACKKHSNMQFLVDELKSLNILKTDNLNEVTTDLVCDFYSKDCMYNKCYKCSENKLKIIVDNEELSAKASWFAWVLKDHEYEKAGEKKTTKLMTKIKKEGTLQDLLNIFNAEMKQFKTHIFNFYHQYNKYKDCINNLKSDEACIHIDFSENFTCKYHKEIQAMHFIKEQITLHTGVIYIKGEKKPISFCSISADNQHNPEAIWAHLDPVFQHIKINYPNIFTIHFFSDGPTTQYRQKKNFYLFSEKVYEYGFSYCTWSFFEAAHGKGAADGIGGVIKRTLDAKIAQGKDIPNAETAYDILKSEDTSIKLFYISSSNIKPLNTKLSPLPRTMKIHQLITMEKLKLKYRDLSCFCGDPRGSCECHSPVSHSFLCTINTSEKQSNKQSNFEQENEAKKSKNSKKTRRRYISSSTEEDECDYNIEYAESDASVFFSDGSISPDFNDDETNLTIELDEKTGVLRPKIDPNKKVTVLSTIILKKPNGEIDTKQERKRKIICENKDLMPKRFCETTKHVIGKDDVTILSQIRKKPENIASYDLRESNLFGKEVPVMKIRSNDGNKIKTDNRKIDENKENKNDTIKEIEKTLIEKFVMAEKHKIEIECTKKDESIEILNVIREEEIKLTEENKNNDTIKTEYKKQHESMRGQNNTGDDLQDADKYKETDKTESDEINKSENLKEDKSDKELNLNKEEIKMTIESDANTQNFILNINDSIIVRYFQRNTWKYFIGFVENIEFKDGENYYKVKFLKTVKDIKSDSVKFVVQRKLDVDIVNNISIVKKVNLIQREEASKEYYLSTDFDMVYFS